MRIAVVDDDETHNRLLQGLLTEAGHVCLCFSDATTMMRHLQRETVDLLLLDWNLPSKSGLEILVWTRAHHSTSLPVLLITSRTADEDVVRALGAGADDYIVKPVRPEILLARVEALLRRAYPPALASATETYGAYQFDAAQEAMTLGGEPIALTNKEFHLALLLFRNLSRPLSRGYLLETVWGHRPDLPTRTLDAHVSRVRRKLELRPANGLKLSTVYSYGYRLERCEPSEVEQED